jgi:hypothetical protein
MFLTCHWVISTSDDAMVNLSNLKELLIELDQKYEPFFEPVIIGHCLFTPKHQPYLQGGSGFLFSRFAAKHILDNLKIW